MNIQKLIREQSKQIKSTIILPEANLDERVKKACEFIIENNISNIIIFGKNTEFSSVLVNSDKCEIIDIENYAELFNLAMQLYELRKAKGLTLEQAQELIKNPAYLAMMLLKNNKADGVVAGAKFTTADTLRPALQIIKTKPNKRIVTGCMIMAKEDKNPLVFGDVSLVENPTSENLAEIAESTAEFANKVLGLEPKVALLSYSTKGSAKSEMVEKVQRATELTKTSKFLIDGEMQVDSALDLATATKKGVTSPVGGNANVLIFPDLNAGNIGYKLVARLGGYNAIGPIMLNFNKPVNDLSRGCTVEEIIDTVCITKLQVE